MAHKFSMRGRNTVGLFEKDRWLERRKGRIISIKIMGQTIEINQRDSKNLRFQW